MVYSANANESRLRDDKVPMFPDGQISLKTKFHLCPNHR